MVSMCYNLINKNIKRKEVNKMKNVSQSYWEYIYNGTISYDEDFSDEYNENWKMEVSNIRNRMFQEWEEEVRRMRENKNIKQKGEKDKNVRIK